MKLYGFYTPSHQVLKDEWFIPSLQDDYELKITRYDQECPSGDYKSEGWTKAMLRKTDLLVQAIKENWGEVLIYSDVDAQFFRPTKNVILRTMEKKDFAFQRDSPDGGICAGFFACRGNQRSLKLLEDIQANLEGLSDQNRDKDDQNFLNDLLIGNGNYLVHMTRRMESYFVKFTGKNSGWLPLCLPLLTNSHRLKWTYLPPAFFGGGTLTGRQWQPGMPLEIPPNIILHHANWTVGIENKLEQLRFVRNTVNRRPLLGTPKGC